MGPHLGVVRVRIDEVGGVEGVELEHGGVLSCGQVCSGSMPCQPALAAAAVVTVPVLVR
jgi:hypothetical protein